MYEKRQHESKLFTSFTTFSSWPMYQSRVYGSFEDVEKKEVVQERMLDTNEMDELLHWKMEEFREVDRHKSIWKEFSIAFRNQEKIDWKLGYEYAVDALETIPSFLKWRVCLELGDLVKRKNLVEIARVWYDQMTRLQPFSAQSWLEFSKLEEEHGELVRCRNVIKYGLLFCPFDESLLIKSLKLEERIGDFQAARKILNTIRNRPLDQIWKVIFEGALMESRSGRVNIARKFYKFLIQRMPWYGPVFYEAFKLEEKHGKDSNAKSIAMQGLESIPRYGPLWFGVFKLYERMCSRIGNFDELRALYKKSISCISKELIWKVYLSLAHFESEYGSYKQCRDALVLATHFCPDSLKWKVWLEASEIEILSGNIGYARKLLQRSLNEVPSKNRANVLLEFSRLEELCLNIDKSRRILNTACFESKGEWKVYLESVLLEIRYGDIEAAISCAKSALKIHSGTGRLWSILIQLYQTKSWEDQFEVFKQALAQVPKSGEVWCEGARLLLNPTSPRFNLNLAARYLEFAIRFTPQYGDSFIELLRLELLLHGPDYISDNLVQLCINSSPNYGQLWFGCKRDSQDTAFEILENAYGVVCKDIYRHRHMYQRALMNNPLVDNTSVCMWEKQNINSIHLLYPSTLGLPPKHRLTILFGLSPILIHE